MRQTMQYEGLILDACVNAVIVETDACPNERGTASKGDLEGLPQDGPPAHKLAKGALDGDAHGTLLKVKVVMLATCGCDDRVGHAEGRIGVDEESFGKGALLLDSDSKFGNTECGRIMGLRCLRDVIPGDATLSITYGHA